MAIASAMARTPLSPQVQLQVTGADTHEEALRQCRAMLAGVQHLPEGSQMELRRAIEARMAQHERLCDLWWNKHGAVVALAAAKTGGRDLFLEGVAQCVAPDAPEALARLRQARDGLRDADRTAEAARRSAAATRAATAVRAEQPSASAALVYAVVSSSASAAVVARLQTR